MALPQPTAVHPNGLNPTANSPPNQLATSSSSLPNNFQHFHPSSSQIPANLPPVQSPPPGQKMIGTSAPWNPNITAIPSYPTDETLAAEYRAYLDSYHPSTTVVPPPQSQAHSSATVGYGHEGSGKTNSRVADARDSSSVHTSPYGTAHYASPDPYPPFNPSSIEYGLGHSGDLITNPTHQRQQHQATHRTSTLDSQPQQQNQMLALSPESFSSLESPHSVRVPLGPHSQQYYPQDSRQYFGGDSAAPGGYSNGTPQQSPDWTNQPPPAVTADYSGYQHRGQPAYANLTRPSQATSPYAAYTQGAYQQHPSSIGSVAPGQIFPTTPGSFDTRMPGDVSTNNRQPPNNNQSPPTNKQTSKPPAAAPFRNPAGTSQAAASYSRPPARPAVKPPLQTDRHRRKRTKVDEVDDESESSSDYYADGRQPQSSGPNQPARLPGACGPCKRLKMKCVFPDNQTDCCQRCRNSGRANQCIVGPRKPRQPSNKKEMLLQKLREQETTINSKDAVIRSLIEQIQNPRVHISLRDSPSIASSAIAGNLPADLQQAPHEERPIDKAILEWIEKAQASIQSTPGYRLTDARVLDDDSSESSSLGRHALSPTKSSISESGHSGSHLAAPDTTGSHSIKASPKLHSLPLETTPIGLLAELSLADNKEKEKEAQSKRSRSRSKSRSASGPEESENNTGVGSSAGGGGDEDDGAIGVANRGYFEHAPASNNGLPSNMLERRNIPEIMRTGLISPAEVDKLFKIYFDRLNVFISILDPVLHTPATTFWRCPFLFTVVCAVASRYHTERPELYSIAMHFARRAAASSLIEGAKSVELCQAYILMSVYSMPSRRWEDAREWLYLGLAIRMATDLNLHVKSATKILNEHHERELLNRTRTWLNLYNLDRSASAQLGRPASIRPDPIIRSCVAVGKRPPWWNSSRINDPFDLHLCAYTDLLSSVIAEFQERVYWNPETETTGLRTDLDLVKIAFQYDDKLQEWNSRTAFSFATHSNSSNPQCAYRVRLLPFYVNYLRLVMLSLGFQQAMQKGANNVDPELVKRCLGAACGVLKTVVEDLAPTEYLRFAPDGHFVFSSFSSAFLIKMLRPEHSALLDAEQRVHIINLVERFVDTLKSPRIAVDVRHTPMLYSRFLAGLLAKYKPNENAEVAEHSGESTTIEGTQTDTTGLPTPPMDKRDAPPAPSPPGEPAFTSDGGARKHKTSPSIEISPPGPELPPGIPPAQLQMLYDPLAVDGLFPAPAEDSNASYTASTVHPASTIHGSQYGAPDNMMVDDHILAPMLAMNTPGFWESMMLPGISWPVADDMQWSVNLEDDGSENPFRQDDVGHYHQQGDTY